VRGKTGQPELAEKEQGGQSAFKACPLEEEKMSTPRRVDFVERQNRNPTIKELKGSRRFI